jgi:hypothetical protein
VTCMDVSSSAACWGGSAGRAAGSVPGVDEFLMSCASASLTGWSGDEGEAVVDLGQPALREEADQAAAVRGRPGAPGPTGEPRCLCARGLPAGGLVAWPLPAVKPPAPGAPGRGCALSCPGSRCRWPRTQAFR